MTSDMRPEQGVAFDLSSRTKLRVTGADRLRFLNGQISNDVRKAAPNSAVHACVLTAKGKINADVFLAVDGDSYLVDSEPGTAETLAARIERYIIADDVEVEDVSDEFALFHILGPNVPAVDASKVVQANRFGLDGADLWVSGSLHDAAFQELSRKLPFCDEAGAEIFRIERGVPRVGHELTDKIIPTEANLELRAIDYAKGCYIGQEVISRIKMSGQTNKRLCGFVGLTQARLESGMRLLTVPDSNDVGWITSAAMSSRLGKQIALGFVKRGSQTPGTELDARAGEAQTRVQIVDLPFA